MDENFNHPPVNFRFEVSLNPPEGEFYFSKVTGIEKSIGLSSLQEGGNNSYSHHLPNRTEYTELVLHRGLIPSDSSFLAWCEKSISGNFDEKLVAKTIIVNLLDASGEPLVSWQFNNAFPVRIKVNDLDGENQAVLVEEIGIAYSEFLRSYP